MPAKSRIRFVIRLALVLAVLVPVSACQDQDPLAPIPPRRGVPTPSNVAVVNPVDMNTAGEVWGNQFGQIAGTLEDANGTTHAFLWTPTSPNGTSGDSVLLDAPSSGGGAASGLNDFGQVLVNGLDGVARLWTPSSPNGTVGDFTLISGPYGALVGTDINNRGDVLVNGDGWPTNRCPTTQHPYVWRPPTPNGNLGRLIDVVQGLGVFDNPCGAWGNVLSEEDNGGLEVSGYDDWGDDHIWGVTELDAPLAPKLSWLSWNGTSWTDTAIEGRAIWFYGGDSKPLGVVLTYQWDFGDGSSGTGSGDGSSGTGSSLNHTYADNGQYTVTLTLSDGSGASNSTSIVVTVANVPPTGALSVSPAPPSEGSYVLTIGSVRDVPGDLPSVQEALDCGDGRGLQSAGTGASGGSLNCTAPNDGLRTVRAQLRDKDGGVTEYASQFWIQNVAPTVTVLSAPASITEQKLYTISFKFTDPGVLDNWSYSVNWGDGTSTSPISVSSQGATISASHSYRVDRRGGSRSTTYLVTINVSDNGGASGSAQRTVLVTTK